MKKLNITISTKEMAKFRIQKYTLSFSEFLEIIMKEINNNTPYIVQEPMEKYLVTDHRKTNTDAEKRKRIIISKIQQVKDELLLQQIETELNRTIEKSDAQNTVIKPLRPGINVDEMVEEQNYTGINRADFDQLVNELDIQEDLVELLKSV
jgi:spore germination cell wall hydrolase CwlJ-like protein